MKHKFFMGILPAVSILCVAGLLSVSCKKSEAADTTVTATVSGSVIDDQKNPLQGVTVTFVTADSKKETKATATTGADGKFSVEKVPSTARVVNYTKDGYASTSTTIAETKFQSGKIELETATLIYSMASIEGLVLNLKEEPYQGVSVFCENAKATTDELGCYKFEGLTIKDYTITFEDAEGNTAETKITADKFEKGKAYAENVTVGSYVIPGLSYSEFVNAPYWYGNNYAGGVGVFKMQWNHVGFLTAYPRVEIGGFRNAAEGMSLYDGVGTEAGKLCSYLYGRKQITEGNCYINLCARNFRASAAQPSKLGVGVLDLTANTKEVTYLPAQEIYQGLKKMKNGTSTLDVEHNLFVFDLSAYKGKEIAFAVGVFGGCFPGEEGSPETPIVRILFADKDMTAEFEQNDLSATFTGEKPEGCNWDGFTKANLSSLTPNPGTSFSGNANGAEDGNYTAWAGTNHLMLSWAPEIFNEGTAPLQDGNLFAIAAHRGKFDVPTGYIMSRFNGPKKKMSLVARTYGANPTYFRVTVVDLATFTATALKYTNADPAAAGLSEGENGTIGLLNDKGSVDDPSKFATVTFDLSAYAGKDVVIVISAHKGNNFSIYSVDFAD